VILYCATSNAGKLREFRLAMSRAAPEHLTLATPTDFASIPAPEETGATFEQNAILKAEYYGRYAPGLLFAEDSGLEVNALGGAPGVYSARFAGEAASDAANNSLLLEKLRSVTDRTARFVCTIALVQDGRLLRTFRGEVEGRIADAPLGTEGFGYDPLFFYPPFGCTFGEVPSERKMQVSHRARAAAGLFQFLVGNPA
jgi:XTP/dITP diphosphohydrolase